MPSWVDEIKEGWAESKKLKTYEGFAENYADVQQDLDNQQILEQFLHERDNPDVPYQEPSAIDQGRAEIEALIGSNDPRLGQMAMQMMADQRRAELRTEPAAPTSVREWQFAQEQGSEQTYSDFLSDKRIQQVMNVNNPDARVPLSELRNLQDVEGNTLRFPVGTTYSQLEQAGAMPGSPMTGEESRRLGTFDVAKKDLEDLMDLVNNEGADLSGLGGLFDELRSEGSWMGQGTDMFLNAMGRGDVSPANTRALSLVASISNNIVAAFRGAQVGPAEQEKFEKQLPVAGQPLDVFMSNLELSLENLNYLRERNDLMRGNPNADVSSIPLPSTLEDAPTETPVFRVEDLPIDEISGLPIAPGATPRVLRQ